MQYNTVLYVLCIINTYNTQYTAYPRVLCNPDTVTPSIKYSQKISY